MPHAHSAWTPGQHWGGWGALYVSLGTSAYVPLMISYPTWTVRQYLISEYHSSLIFFSARELFNLKYVKPQFIWNYRAMVDM